MAELVDALASGASIRKDVEVRVLFWAPAFPKALKPLENRQKHGFRSVFATNLCYGSMLIVRA